MIDSYDPRISIEGNGDSLVLVPGLNGTGELFYRQIPSLRQAYRVATYSLRDDAPTLDVLANDLARVIEQEGPGEREPAPSLLDEEEEEMFEPAPERVVFDVDEDLDIPDFLKS